MEAFFCPRPIWKSGTLASVVSLQVSVLLIVMCVAIMVIRTSSRINERKLSPVFALLRSIAKNDYYCVTTMLYALLIVSATWINYGESYYCVGPSGILVRPSVIAAPRAWGWDDVKIVSAHCAVTKFGFEGGLSLTLENGTTIPLRLKTGTTGAKPGDYAPIEAALAGRAYRFALTPSVTQNTCPPQLYRAFTDWHK